MPFRREQKHRSFIPVRAMAAAESIAAKDVSGASLGFLRTLLRTAARSPSELIVFTGREK